MGAARVEGAEGRPGSTAAAAAWGGIVGLGTVVGGRGVAAALAVPGSGAREVDGETLLDEGGDALGARNAGVLLE